MIRLLPAIAACLSFATAPAIAEEQAADMVAKQANILATARSPQERFYAAANLHNRGAAASSALPAMMASVQRERDAKVRDMIARALGMVGVGRDDAVAVLVQLLERDPESDVRASAAESLGNIARQPDTSSAALIAALRHDKTEEVRKRAAAALAAKGLAPAAKDSVAALADALRDEPVAYSAAEALAAFGPAAASAVPALREALKASAAARLPAARALAAIGPAAVSATPECVAALADKDEDVRVEAAITLLAIQSEATPAFDALAAALSFEPHSGRLSDRTWRSGVIVRAAAGLTLNAARAPPNVLPMLAALCGDDDDDIRQFAADALRAISAAQAAARNRAALPALIEARRILQQAGDTKQLVVVDQAIAAMPETPWRGWAFGSAAGVAALAIAGVALQRWRRHSLPKVMLSYRRQQSAAFCGRLYDRLVAKWGHERVFRDIDSLAPGQAFAGRIAESIRACDAVIVIIGPNWAGTASDLTRRIDDADDWVRLEVATALAQGKRVVPVLHDGARMPLAADLPADIAALADRQAIDISDLHFSSGAARLMRAVVETRS